MKMKEELEQMIIALIFESAANTLAVL